MPYILNFLYVVCPLLWIIALVKMVEHGKREGLVRALVSLLVIIGIGVLLFFAMIWPTLGCEGFFCALGARFLYLVIMGLLLVAVPCWMLAVTIKMYKAKKSGSTTTP